MSWGAPASRFSRNLWLILSTSTSLWVRSSSDLSPDSNVMEGRTVTGGTGRAVRIIHSGRQDFGDMPSGSRSWSGMRSRRSRTSLGVSLWPSSRKVVGLSRVILSWSAPQWGQIMRVAASLAVIFAMSRSSIESPPRSSTWSMDAMYSLACSSVSSRRPQERQVDWRSFLISFTYPTWMTGMARSMLPKCPGHSSTLWPQVLHRRPGSMTPRWGSINPMSIGNPSSS